MDDWDVVNGGGGNNGERGAWYAGDECRVMDGERCDNTECWDNGDNGDGGIWGDWCDCGDGGIWGDGGETVEEDDRTLSKISFNSSSSITIINIFIVICVGGWLLSGYYYYYYF